MQKINKKQIRITTKQKIGLILFGIFLALITLEFGLRIGGFVVSYGQSAGNRITGMAAYENQKTYTILCLGESTTADLYGNKNSWPIQLEIILNNKSSETKFKVFNEGVGGTNTAFILSRLKNNLDKYKPDMVITMMGINDRSLNIIYEKTFKVEINLLFKDLRICKLSKLLWVAWKNKVQYNVTNNINTLEKPESIKEDMYTEDAQKYMGLGKIYQEEDRFEEAEEMFKKVIETNPGGDSVYTQLVHVYHGQGISNKEIEKFYRKNGFVIRVQNDISYFNITKYHYQQLYKELNKKGIKYIIMQYPTLDINKLKDMFEENEDIIFVSNKENFKKVLETGNYEDYFIDKFAGNFGHCTLKGNRLIAENVADAILKELKIN